MSLEENIVPLARDSVDTIDTLRSSLEMNVTILQESLRLWQTCEAEYEGLKEEMLNMREDASEEELVCKEASSILSRDLRTLKRFLASISKRLRWHSGG